MRQSDQIRVSLLTALADECDCRLMACGFKRREGATTYGRKIEQARQSIAFVADLFPKYEPGAEVHIHPMMGLRIPAVTEKALELVDGDNMLLANSPKVLLNQPVEFTAPKELHKRWFCHTFNQYGPVVEEIAEFICTSVMPVFQLLTSPLALVEAYERGEPRVFWQQHSYVYLAASYCLCEQVEKAREVLEKNLGAPGLKSRYSVVFEQLKRG